MMPSQAARDRLSHRLRTAGSVFAEQEADALLAEASGDAQRLEALTARRVGGEPLEVVLGHAEFDGCRVAIEAGVFVPRQRSVLLLDVAGAQPPRPGDQVLDLCCGSGALALAASRRWPGIEVHASDVDPTACRVARTNLRADGHGSRVYRGDLFAGLPSGLRGELEIVLVNAPYVPSDDVATMPREAREHEPRRSLDGGPDGLTLHRRIGDDAVRWLRPGGRVLVETSDAQSDATAAAFDHRLWDVDVHRQQERAATAVRATRR